jgi:alpha-L-fucosidase
MYQSSILQLPTLISGRMPLQHSVVRSVLAYLVQQSSMPHTEQTLDVSGKYATYVAKHVCGFDVSSADAVPPPTKKRTNTTPLQMWHTNVSFPEDGFSRYNYSVMQSGFKVDVLRKFALSLNERGIKLGIYYSVNANEYLNVGGNAVRPASTLKPGQVAVTQALYDKIVLAQLRELWGAYGDVAEIWYDGGFEGELADKLRALQRELAPNAVGFNGFGASDSPIRWIGTESGVAPYPTWLTGDCTGGPHGGSGGPGSSTSTDYCPAEVDFTLQSPDVWFWKDGTSLKSLETLAKIYHASAGHSGNMLLNIAPATNGRLPAQTMRRYREFGDWMRRCYNSTNTLAELNATAGHSAPDFKRLQLSVKTNPSVRLALPSPQRLDRFVLMETIEEGQRIRLFHVTATRTTSTTRTISTSVGMIAVEEAEKKKQEKKKKKKEEEEEEKEEEEVVVFNGSAVGHKLIGFFSQGALDGVSALTMHLDDGFDGAGSLSLFQAVGMDKCNVTGTGPSPPSTQCTFRQGYAYTGPNLGVPRSGLNATACCAACAAAPTCAIFVLTNTALASSRTVSSCALKTAQQGGGANPNAISGAPN